MHLFALRLQARMPLASCVHCAKRIVKKDSFLAVISAEMKPPLSALLPFSCQSNLLAAVMLATVVSDQFWIPSLHLCFPTATHLCTNHAHVVAGSQLALQFDDESQFLVEMPVICNVAILHFSSLGRWKVVTTSCNGG